MLQPSTDDLLLQALETEIGAVHLYTAVLGCAVDPSVKEAWRECLSVNRRRVATIEAVCRRCSIDCDARTPGCAIVKCIGEGLLDAVGMARRSGNREHAESVASECVQFAKDHLNWEVIGELADQLEVEPAAAPRPRARLERAVTGALGTAPARREHSRSR
jgi:hypothetical protein